MWFLLMVDQQYKMIKHGAIDLNSCSQVNMKHGEATDENCFISWVLGGNSIPTISIPSKFNLVIVKP